MKLGKKYTEIEFCWGCSIDDAVNELLDYKNDGLLVFGEFNGVKLYSDIVTIDKAYKDITGKTKSEHKVSYVELMK